MKQVPNEPEIIDAVYVVEEEEPRGPRGFAEKMANEAETLERHANAAVEEMRATGQAIGRMVNVGKRMFGKLSSEFQIVDRKPLGR